MKKVLVICGDTVDLNMGGVGVRSWELARALSGDFSVSLAIPNQSSLQAEGLRLVSFDLQGGDLRPLCQGVDVIITQGFVLHFHPYLRELNIPIAIDLYVPFLLESLVWHSRDALAEWTPAYEEYLRVQLDLLRSGDFFFCASERQRDYWLGWLHAQKRINPHTYRQDPTFRELIDLVPFGIQEGMPAHPQAVLKGVLPGIQPSDRLILWSGGLWDWLDPLILIRAMKRLQPAHPELKLYFLGTRHPNPTVIGFDMPDRTIQLSRDLGLYGQTVFFGDWVPYDQRGAYLAEADLSVVTHLNHLETHFSFRTRVLDCIWAEIPVVASNGDALSEFIQQNGIGLSVPAGDESALAAAIESVLANLPLDSYPAAFQRVKEAFRWKTAIEPLRRFCLEPRFAPDRGQYLTDVERISRDKDAFLEQVAHDKDAFWQAIVDDRERTIQRYRTSPPFRAYAWLKKLVGR